MEESGFVLKEEVSRWVFFVKENSCWASPTKKIKSVRWIELKLINQPIVMDFNFNNIDNLWYYNNNYKSYLRH